MISQLKSRLLASLVSSMIVLALLEPIGIFLGGSSLSLLGMLVPFSILALAAIGAIIIKKLRTKTALWLAFFANAVAFIVLYRAITLVFPNIDQNRPNLLLLAVIGLVIYWAAQFIVLSVGESLVSTKTGNKRTS